MIYYRNIICAAHGWYVTSDDTSALSHEKKPRQRGRGAFCPPDDARNRRQGPAGENSRYGQGFRRSLSFLLRFLYIYPFFFFLSFLRYKYPCGCAVSIRAVIVCMAAGVSGLLIPRVVLSLVEPEGAAKQKQVLAR